MCTSILLHYFTLYSSRNTWIIMYVFFWKLLCALMTDSRTHYFYCLLWILLFVILLQFIQPISNLGKVSLSPVLQYYKLYCKSLDFIFVPVRKHFCWDMSLEKKCFVHSIFKISQIVLQKILPIYSSNTTIGVYTFLVVSNIGYYNLKKSSCPV